MEINRFNIRAYGILLNDRQEVLLVHEKNAGTAFTKFPGGGLEFGEGIKDCLVREYKEETGIDIQVDKHIYTTDFFQQSAFRKTDQLISVYYAVSSAQWHTIRLDEHTIVNGERSECLRFVWIKLNELNENMLTFPVDKLVSRLLIQDILSPSTK